MLDNQQDKGHLKDRHEWEDGSKGNRLWVCELDS